MEKIELKAINVVDVAEYETLLNNCVDDDDVDVNLCDFQYTYRGPFPKHDMTTDFSKLLPEGSAIITDMEPVPFFVYSVYVRYGDQVVNILCAPDYGEDNVTTYDNEVRIVTGTLVRSLQDAANVIQRINITV